MYIIDKIRFEWNEHFGPAVVGRSGQILKGQPKPRARFWKAVGWWREQGCKVTEGGVCVYTEPPEPQLVQLVGKHYVEVSEAREPEDVRREWLAKLKPNP